MTFTLPSFSLPGSFWPALLWLLVAALLWLWLRKELTPRRFLSIWESEGVLSTRLLGATALLIWSMCMYSAGRMGDTGLGQVLGWVAGFFAVGGVVRAANSLKAPTTVNTNNLNADVTTGEVNFQAPAAGGKAPVSTE